jgi:hypothetical protein
MSRARIYRQMLQRVVVASVNQPQGLGSHMHGFIGRCYSVL